MSIFPPKQFFYYVFVFNARSFCSRVSTGDVKTVSVLKYVKINRFFDSNERN